MKKNIILLTILFCSLLALSSCSKSFLDTAPKGDFSEETLKNVDGGTETILEGIHGMMYTYRFGQWFGNGIHSLNTRVDWLSDLYINTRPAYYMQIYRWTDHISPYGNINSRAWDSWYTVIQHCNKILSLSDKESYATVVKYNTVMAETYMLRAYAMSNLVQAFSERYNPNGDNSGLGIIVRTEPTLEPMERSSVKDTYVQILSDVEKGLKLFEELKKDNKLLKGKKNRIIYATAYGMAAKIYLGKQDYENAAKCASKAIEFAEATGFARLQQGSELLDGFNNSDAREWLWGYKHSSAQNPFFAGWGAHYSYNFLIGNKFPTFAINRSYYDKMGKNDVRRKWFIARQKLDDGKLEPFSSLYKRMPEDVNKVGVFLVRRGKPDFEYSGNQIKFKTAGGQGSSMMDALFMRLGELYFIKAEAEARIGHEADAIQALESVMQTRDPDYKVVAGLSGEDLLKEIFRNKWIDLYYEGGVFFDQKRIAHVPNRLAATNIQYLEPKDQPDFIVRNSGDFAEKIATSTDDRAWQFAIPYDEIKGNKLCKQNPLK